MMIHQAKLWYFPAGRDSVLVREAAEPGGKALDVTPQGFAVRTLAQEYGGGSGAFAVQGDTVVFSNYSDQRLYKQTIGGGTDLLLTDCQFDIKFLLICDYGFNGHILERAHTNLAFISYFKL